jgi:hypothetical protein
MPDRPHQYLARGRQALPVAWHDWFVEQIRRHGHRGKFGGARFTYMELDGWKYWAIGAVINRERVSG